VGRVGVGEGREVRPHGRWGMSARTLHVRADAGVRLCGRTMPARTRFCVRTDVTCLRGRWGASTRIRCCVRGTRPVRADVGMRPRERKCFSPGNFITDATVRPSPSGLAAIVRSSVCPSVCLSVRYRPRDNPGLNGRPMVEFTVRTSARVHVYPADSFLLADRFLPSTPMVKKRIRTEGLMHLCGRANASARKG
jgi:hypothetical protein